MTGTWFNRHERFGDCKPNEVYIGCNVFAEFCAGKFIRLRTANGLSSLYFDYGGISILAGALKEWEEKNRCVPPNA